MSLSSASSSSRKEGKVKEIADIRDETDLSGLRIAIDLKRGVDPDKLMAKLYRSTTLQDSFSCNFNVLVDGYPRVMGVRQILHEWVKWRIESTRRRINFDLGKKSERLHLLHGLEAILLAIDKAIAIIRGTKLEAEVVPNLMKGFDIDETQAEFVAELKLRNINEEYILNRTKDIAKLEGEIAELEEDPLQRGEHQEGHQRRAGRSQQEVRDAASHGHGSSPMRLSR